MCLGLHWVCVQRNTQQSCVIQTIVQAGFIIMRLTECRIFIHSPKNKHRFFNVIYVFRAELHIFHVQCKQI